MHPYFIVVRSCWSGKRKTAFKLTTYHIQGRFTLWARWTLAQGPALGKKGEEKEKKRKKERKKEGEKERKK